MGVPNRSGSKGRTLVISRQASLGELLDEFEPRAKASTRLLLRYWRKHLGPLRLQDITPVLISKHRDMLLGAPTKSFGQKTLKPRSPSTVLHYLCALSSAFRFAIRDLHWLEINPVANVSKPAASRWRTRFLSDLERERLLHECEHRPHLYAAVLLSITTGLRQGELYRLNWGDLDERDRWAILGQTKNGDSRGIPLVPAVLEALRKLPRTEDKVFPFDLTKSWRTALARAEIANFRWHDLRHSAASLLARSGANSIEIATLLGHRTLGMVSRYAHLANGHTRSLVDRVMEDVR